MYQGQKVHIFCSSLEFLAEAQPRFENRRGQKVLSVDIKNWDKHQICIKSKFKNIHFVNLAFYK
jgi:hypothetical protein